MKCGKCKFETKKADEMIEHLKTNHKIETAEYYKKEIQKRENKMETYTQDDLFMEEAKDKTIQCELCSEENLTEDLNKSNTNLIVIPDGIFEVKKQLGWINKGDIHFCPKCQEKNKTMIKKWDFYNKILDMRNKICSEKENVENSLIKKSMFSRHETEEFDYFLVYSKKVKNNIEVTINVNNEEADIKNWSNNNMEEIKANFTEAELNNLKIKAQELYKKISEEETKIEQKYERELGVIPLEYDEYGMTYLKDFNKFSYKKDVCLFSVSYNPSETDDDENYVTRILIAKNFDVKEKYFEVMVSEDKLIYEVIWDSKSIENKKLCTREEIKEKLALHSNGLNYVQNMKETLNANIEKLKKMLLDNSREESIIFAGKELKFTRTNEKENIFGVEKVCIFDMQARDQFNNEEKFKLSMNAHYVSQLLSLIEKELEWLMKIEEKYSSISKINKVGENSRHIVLDKKGLSVFFGYDFKYDFPNDTEIEVHYERDKIVISKLEEGDREKLVLE